MRLQNKNDSTYILKLSRGTQIKKNKIKFDESYTTLKENNELLYMRTFVENMTMYPRIRDSSDIHQNQSTLQINYKQAMKT